MNNLNFDRLSDVCGWLTTLPVYMFHGELTAALILYAYDKPDLSAVDPAKQRLFRETFEETLMLSPSFTLRGGTREIMRGVIARGLGLR